MYKHRKNFTLTPSTFNGMLDNVLSGNWENFFSDDQWNKFTVPVNIKETDSAYVLDVVAPGLNKEDFDISVEKDILTISFEQKETKEESTDKVLRSEYKYSSFKRSFSLSERINANEIKASYNNGVLNISLAKVVPAEEPTRKIEIA